MIEIAEVIARETKTMAQDGTIEGFIKDELKKTIAKGIEDALRSYSDFGKVIGEKINESVQTASRGVNLPQYNQFIQEVVVSQFEKILRREAVEHLSGLIGKIIEPVEKATTSSKILREIEDAIADEMRESGEEVIQIEEKGNPEGTARHVTIKGPYGDKLRVTFYNFHRDDEDLWHIGYINKDGTPITGGVMRAAAVHLDTLDSIFFKYYAMGTKIDMDEEFYSINLTDY